jgi:hypothetical protein
MIAVEWDDRGSMSVSSGIDVPLYSIFRSAASTTYQQKDLIREEAT